MQTHARIVAHSGFRPCGTSSGCNPGTKTLGTKSEPNNGLFVLRFREAADDSGTDCEASISSHKASETGKNMFGSYPPDLGPCPPWAVCGSKPRILFGSALVRMCRAEHPQNARKSGKLKKGPERGRKQAFFVTTHISRISAQNLPIQRRKTVETTENCTVFFNLYWGRLRHAPAPRLSRAV